MHRRVWMVCHHRWRSLFCWWAQQLWAPANMAGGAHSIQGRMSRDGWIGFGRPSSRLCWASLEPFWASIEPLWHFDQTLFTCPYAAWAKAPRREPRHRAGTAQGTAQGAKAPRREHEPRHCAGSQGTAQGAWAKASRREVDQTCPAMPARARSGTAVAPACAGSGAAALAVWVAASTFHTHGKFATGEIWVAWWVFEARGGLRLQCTRSAGFSGGDEMTHFEGRGCTAACTWLGTAWCGKGLLAGVGRWEVMDLLPDSGSLCLWPR